MNIFCKWLRYVDLYIRIFVHLISHNVSIWCYPWQWKSLHISHLLLEFSVMQFWNEAFFNQMCEYWLTEVRWFKKDIVGIYCCYSHLRFCVIPLKISLKILCDSFHFIISNMASIFKNNDWPLSWSSPMITKIVLFCF